MIHPDTRMRYIRMYAFYGLWPFSNIFFTLQNSIIQKSKITKYIFWTINIPIKSTLPSRSVMLTFQLVILLLSLVISSWHIFYPLRFIMDLFLHLSERAYYMLKWSGVMITTPFALALYSEGLVEGFPWDEFQRSPCATTNVWNLKQIVKSINQSTSPGNFMQELHSKHLLWSSNIMYQMLALCFVYIIPFNMTASWCVMNSYGYFFLYLFYA